MEQANIWEGAEVISTYTRAQALEDGVLVDVSTTAKEAGIRFPTAITRAVWVDCVALPDGYRGAQDERGRLWDVIRMLRFAISIATVGQSLLYYRLHVRKLKQVNGHWVDAGGERTPPLVTLKAVCGPGDDGEPVITVMLPDED